MHQPVTHPSKQWPTIAVIHATRTRDRLGLVSTIAGQDSVAIDVFAGGRVQPLEQSETSSFSFSSTKAQADEDLERTFNQELSR